MTKTLTEQWYDNTIDRSHHYYVRIKGKEEMNYGGIDFIDIIRPPLFRDQLDKLMKYNDPEVLAPVPDYRVLYDKDQGIFPVLNIVLRNIEREQCRRKLTNLELSIKSQVKGVLEFYGLARK